MDKNKMLDKIAEFYSNGGNIMKYLRDNSNSGDSNSLEDIMISYDFQAGSYTKKYYENPEIYLNETREQADIIDKLDGHKHSLFEAGMGEGQVLVSLMSQLHNRPEKWGGADISWSRVKAAQIFCSEHGLEGVENSCVMGDMFHLPLADNSVDIVYTNHAMEPNTNHEKELLMELYRVAREYLVLNEPAYELANDEQRNRMEKMGYIKNLYKSAKELGYDVIEWKLADYSANPMNPTGIMVIRKNIDNKIMQVSDMDFSCPVTHSPLEKIGNMYYSEKAFLGYPILDGVPGLLKEYAVVATHLKDFV